jgi:hypothetical protein
MFTFFRKYLICNMYSLCSIYDLRVHGQMSSDCDLLGSNTLWSCRSRKLVTTYNHSVRRTQNNSELGHYHIEGGGGSKTAKCLSICTITENIFAPFNFDRSGDILIHWLLHYTVLCEPKELQNSVNADTCLKPHALLLQPKRTNLTSDSTGWDWVISPRTCYHFAVFPSLPRVYL